ASKGSKKVAVLRVQVVLEDHAAVAEIGAKVEQVVVLAADQTRPERHDLHEPAGARPRYGVFAEITLDLYQGKDQLRIDSRADRLERKGAEKIEPRLEVGNLLSQA